MHRNTRQCFWILLVLSLVGALAVWCQYRWDNKYASTLSGDWGTSVLQASLACGRLRVLPGQAARSGRLRCRPLGRAVYIYRAVLQLQRQARQPSRQSHLPLFRHVLPARCGTPGSIVRLIAARFIIYGLLCFASLPPALSNLALWVLDRDKLTRLMGLLCTTYALRIAYPFVRAP